MDARTDADEWMNYSIARLLGRSTAARFILDSSGRGEEKSEKRGGLARDLGRSGWIPGSLKPLTLLLFPFRILTASRPRSRYISFLYAPPVLVNDFYRVTDESASSSTSDVR